ncbi:FGGY-family carbohydrate kinase [Leeuwenhoekiella sp. A16]|uniref:FGGY-family carbohydrate kinase n=1 Tax=unclassified Leeuwenhoekiella TaxID=2615029 RepID=UPI003A80E99E
MKKTVTAIFDIGKTNKKFFLFDTNFQEVYREYIKIDEIVDEDGHPTENLPALRHWVKKVFDRILNTEKYNIKAINFSSYGASLVHLDKNREVILPMYNYTKQMPASITQSFYEKYGPELEFHQCTGSSNLGMLNVGMHLYWLKYAKPDIFKQIKYSLHLPQYLSFVFTGIPLSEYTSIGCHTALWDYNKKDYHSWVYSEQLNEILPPIVSTETSINMAYKGKCIKIGVGIHDSSAALLPYLRSVKTPFILVSTGTWSISLNPFIDKILSKKDAESGCVNYMLINGKPVKSSRVFLGNEYKIQIEKLTTHYGVHKDYHKTVNFAYDIYHKIMKEFDNIFHWESIETADMPSETILPYTSFEYAYHHLMIELINLEVHSINKAKGEMKIDHLFVDGGFSDNAIYIQLLSRHFKNIELYTADSSLGSALGAAICISDSPLNSKFLKKNYSLKKHIPFITK